MSPINGKASLATLRTPALILDLAVLRRNIAAMSRRAAERGVDLRPHCKTSKCVEIARLATEGQSGGVTVSTLREAEYFIHNGFDDVTYAVGILPDKLPAVAALQERGGRVSVLTDDPEIATAIARSAADLGAKFRVLIEVDCGDGRAGVDVGSTALLEIGRRLHAAEGVELGGVLTHGGHSYEATAVEGIRKIAEQERDQIVRAAERLRHAGLPCPVVSLGSTPTAVHGVELPGVTEIRPGTFVFFDLMMVALGVCGYDEIALSVLTSVIGHQRERGHALIDAGALALSKDTGIRRSGPYGAYGLIRKGDGADPWPGLAIADVSQEHGKIVSTDGGVAFPFDALPIGSRVRAIPNHACLTAAAHDRYFVVDGTDRIVAEWPRLMGW
jgi:D-serine deaminase-like pyridoxal phosphate-dependent protein